MITIRSVDTNIIKRCICVKNMKREKDKKILMIQKIVIGMTKKQVTRYKKKSEANASKINGDSRIQRRVERFKLGREGANINKIVFFYRILTTRTYNQGTGAKYGRPPPRL